MGGLLFITILVIGIWIFYLKCQEEDEWTEKIQGMIASYTACHSLIGGDGTFEDHQRVLLYVLQKEYSKTIAKRLSDRIINEATQKGTSFHHIVRVAIVTQLEYDQGKPLTSVKRRKVYKMVALTVYF